MTALRRLADGNQPNSFSNRMRDRRFRLFESLVESLPAPVRIIDIGGTSAFWVLRGWDRRRDVRIVVVNLFEQPQQARNIVPRVGDATNLQQFPAGSFDIAFSNSVIEHLYTFANQQRMAGEMMRVGNAVWLQTPNYWFPMEPHFHVPGWQWLPRSARVHLLKRFRCGWRGPTGDTASAERLVDEVRLLTRRELEALFPAASIVPEHFAGLVKSWIVHTGFAARTEAPLRLAA